MKKTNELINNEVLINNEAELDEATLMEVAGGGKVCNFFGNCKYVCKECGETFATHAMANWHFIKMSFKGGGLRHTIREI